MQCRCGLCNYDGVVEPGPEAELHSIRGTTKSRLPTTFATAVNSDSAEEDDDVEEYGLTAAQISIDDSDSEEV